MPNPRLPSVQPTPPNSSRVSPSGRRPGLHAGLAFLYVLLAAVPLAFLAVQVGTWIRNVPHWDEFDTVLAFLLTVDQGDSWSEVVRQCFAVNNEHRMLASRVLFATSYWIWGSIDFSVLAVVGNLFLLATFGLLLAREDNPPARFRLAAVFGLAVFHLQHHESLFWAGSSIDHFFVVLAAVTALGALVSGGRAALPVAGFAAFLASYSLAHGLLVWPIGVGLLALQRRWRAAAAWGAVGAGILGTFFAGFEFNPGHRLPGAADLPATLVYALRLVGSSAACGDLDVAPWLGALFLVGVAAAAIRGASAREWFGFAVIAWCLASMGMIAWGRALLSNEWAPVASRYVILSSIAWGLLVWLMLERILARQPRLTWWPAPIVGALAIFNLTANVAHENAGRLFAAGAENAVEAFRASGSFARAVSPPYPDPERADALIREVERRGIYRLPAAATLRFARPQSMPVADAREIGDASYFIEEVAVDAAEVRVRGWAFQSDETARPGDIAVVFRTPDQLVAYEAVPRPRPDVAEAFERWDAIHAGFELRLRRERLPKGELDVAIGFELTRSPKFMMTAHKVVNRLEQDVSMR